MHLLRSDVCRQCFYDTYHGYLPSPFWDVPFYIGVTSYTLLKKTSGRYVMFKTRTYRHPGRGRNGSKCRVFHVWLLIKVCNCRRLSIVLTSPTRFYFCLDGFSVFCRIEWGITGFGRMTDNRCFAGGGKFQEISIGFLLLAKTATPKTTVMCWS